MIAGFFPRAFFLHSTFGGRAKGVLEQELKWEEGMNGKTNSNAKGITQNGA